MSLTHLNAQGEVHMVSVEGKESTRRLAKAQAWVTMEAETFVLLEAGQTPKGDVLATVRLAGIMAAKQTSQLIPLCHPIMMSKASVEVFLHPPDRVEIRATVGCEGQTGVEMEALTAATVAALTLYDMLKAVDKAMQIGPVRLLSKEGGRSGSFIAP
jgi:cyclic pyranopterin phosphate synthase